MRVQPMPPDLIPTMAEAEESLAQVYRSLFYFAAIAFIGGVAAEPSLLVVAFVFGSLALLLRQFQSRTAALVVAGIAAVNFFRVLAATPTALPNTASELFGSLLDLVDGLLGSAVDLGVAAVAAYAAFRFHQAQKAFNAALAQAERARSA